MKPETIALFISMTSFAVGILHQVWRISQAVSAMRHNLEKQDLRLEGLSDRQVLAFNGYKEKIEHFINRTRSELKDIDVRLQDAEHFLTKTTEFTKRR
jgi:hypothetical protein